MRKNRTKRRTRRRRRMRGGFLGLKNPFATVTNPFAGLFSKKKKPVASAGIAEPTSPQEPADFTVESNPNEATDSNPSFDAGSDANDDTPAAAQG